MPVLRVPRSAANRFAFLLLPWPGLRGASGYLALYRFDPVRDIVRLLRIRHQREVGYRD